MEAIIKLLEPDADAAERFATLRSVSRDEMADAGKNGYKAAYIFEVWAAEYAEQPELEYNGRRLTIYRTYGPRKDDKIELYTAERTGRRYGDSY